MNSCHADVASFHALGFVVVDSELQCNLNVWNNTEVNCASNCFKSFVRKAGDNVYITGTHVFARLLYKESVVMFKAYTRECCLFLLIIHTVSNREDCFQTLAFHDYS